MLRLARHLLPAPWAFLLACGPLAATAPSEKEGAVAGGGAGLPTTQATACDPPEVGLPDGSCFRPGIPPDGCSTGFEHDGEYGCEPIVPNERCPPGTMAVPGDVACRPVMPCGDGRWGDLPVDATTQYVDGSYAGGDSDGSSERPWTTIKRAYQAAEADALIAVAEGIYAEQLLFRSKPIVVWGVCPDKVSVVGNGNGDTFGLGLGTDGSELGGMAITSNALGVGISQALDITLDRLWIHDTAKPGIAILAEPGRSSAHVVDSLIEGAHDMGIFVGGSDLHLSGSVLRDTHPRAGDQGFGVGIGAHMTCGDEACDALSRPQLDIDNCLIEGNRSQGIHVMAGDFTLKATVVRDTSPRLSDQEVGSGVHLQLACSWLDRCFAELPTRATISGSLIENSHTSGISLTSSKVEIETTVVRGTLPQASSQEHGVGIMIQADCSSGRCAAGTGSVANIQRSLFEDNHVAELLNLGSALNLESTVARDTQPRAKDLRFGAGIMTQHACDEIDHCSAELPGKLEVDHCLIANNHVGGIMVVTSQARLNAIVVQDTVPQRSDALFGDGVLFVGDMGVATGDIKALSIKDSARAGLANFGADVNLAGSRIGCAAFALVGERYKARPFRLEDGGDNLCGCPEPSGVCKAVSSGLEPPNFLP